MPNVSTNINGRGRGGGFKGKNKLAASKKSNKQASGTKGLECNFCNHGSEDEKVFGKLHTLDNVSAHYNCLLFSSGLGQNGEEEEGIEGFFLEDIKKELRRSSKLKCCYCRQNGASIGCLERRCKRSYHFLCGLKAFALFQFTGNFCSYCVDHRPFQEGVNRGQEVECPICMEELIADPKIAVWAACCKKDDWFHKECVQNMANSAGYFFKCPLCNDKDTFTESMQLCGIHVPEQDAVWELEPNAFSDLYERRIHCDAPVCKCPEGRKQDDLGTRWEILLCDLCGTTGVHIVCGKLPFSCTKWNCSSCIEMLEESSKRSKDEMRQRRLSERKERTSKDTANNRRVGRQSLNATISVSNPSSASLSPSAPRGRGRGRGSRGNGRQSLNATIAVISPSSSQGGKGQRKSGARQSINVNTDSSPSRTVITLPSTPKRRRSSEPLVLPRKIARIENTPIKELKRALLTPNKEPVVELERIKITHISGVVDIEVDVEVEDKVSSVSRSLTKIMECESTTTSSDKKSEEINSFGANKSNNSKLSCDIPSDTLEISDLDFKDVVKEKNLDENRNSSTSVVGENENSSFSDPRQTIPDINEEKNQGLSTSDNVNKNSINSNVDENENSSFSVSKETMPDVNEENLEGFSNNDNIRKIEESGRELSESAVELKNFALTAQGIMNELQLTEAEVLNLVNKSITKETLAKSDITRFFRYNLSIKKMMEIKEMLESVFNERKAIIKSAQNSSRKKSKQTSPTTNKDSLSYAAHKENDIISKLRSPNKSENIELTPSVSPKLPNLPVKSSNQVISSVSTLHSENGNSAPKSDIINSCEEIDKKISGKIPTESPKKVDKLVINMRSSPRKHLKTPPTNILCSKTVETDIGTSKTATATPEDTGNVTKSIMEVSCGIPDEQSTIDKTTSPRRSFGSPNLVGSPRKFPKSRIASPEKIAQGCILTWDEDSEESNDVPSKEDDSVKSTADNSRIVDDTSQEEVQNPVDDFLSENDSVLSDARIQCIDKVVPVNNEECSITNKSLPDGEVEGDLDPSNPLNFEDNSLSSPPSNSTSDDDNAHQEEQQLCSAESPTNETVSNNFTHSSTQSNEQLDTLRKQRSSAPFESIGILENTEQSTSAISNTRITLDGQSERYPASIETQCDNQKLNKKDSLKGLRVVQNSPGYPASTGSQGDNKLNKKSSLKGLRVVQPESKLRHLRLT